MLRLLRLVAPCSHPTAGRAMHLSYGWSRQAGCWLLSTAGRAINAIDVDAYGWSRHHAAAILSYGWSRHYGLRLVAPCCAAMPG